MKHYIIDTNVLIQDPASFLKFEEHKVVLPEVVLEELDALKKSSNNEARFAARKCAKELDKFRGNLYEGVDLPDGGVLQVELNRNHLEVPESWAQDKADNRILSIAKSLQQESENVVIVTKDVLLRIKADSIGVPAEDYHNERVDSLHDGWQTIFVSSEEINQIYSEKQLPREGSPNTFYLAVSSENPSHTALLQGSQDGRIAKLINPDPYFYGMKLNVQQKFAREALLSNIPLVTILGATGSGKTILSLGAGLNKTIEEELYRRILICRPIVGMGEELGFLPGGEQEKIAPYMRPIWDNLEKLIDYNNKEKLRDEVELREKINYLFDSRKITMEAIAYLQGRSITHNYILIDEAQNLTPRQAKGIITRAGEGTKIVMVGDVDQINSPFLDKYTNGLSWAIEKMKGSHLHAHISLAETKRSPLAEDAGKRMG